MGTKLSAAVAKLKSHNNERAKLIGELAMWAKVEEQGIDPETVSTFTWWEAFTTPEQKRERSRAQRAQRPDPFVEGGKVKQYNAVRLKDGTLKQLDPIVPRP